MHSVTILAFLPVFNLCEWQGNMSDMGIPHPVTSTHKNICRSSSSAHYCYPVLTKTEMYQQTSVITASIKFHGNLFNHSPSCHMCTDRWMDREILTGVLQGCEHIFIIVKTNGGWGGGGGRKNSTTTNHCSPYLKKNTCNFSPYKTGQGWSKETLLQSIIYIWFKNYLEHQLLFRTIATPVNMSNSCTNITLLV
jgi:hypothetical protein